MHSRGVSRWGSCTVASLNVWITSLIWVSSLTVNWARFLTFNAQSSLIYAFLQLGRLLSQGKLSPAITQRSIIKTILRKNNLYHSTILFQNVPVLYVRQLFIKRILPFIRNDKNTVSLHTHLMRGKTNSGFQIPSLTLSLEKRNVHYLAHVVYRNIPSDIVHSEGCSAAVYKSVVCKWFCEIGGRDNEWFTLNHYVDCH